MAPPTTGPEGQYLATVSAVDSLGGGLYLVRIQLADGTGGYVVVPDTLTTPHGVRLAVGAAATILNAGGFVA